MGNRQQPANPIEFCDHWYLIRNTPKRFRDVETRACVYLSTGIRVRDDVDGKRARAKVRELDEALQQKWKSLQKGDEHAEEVFKAYVDLARQSGFDYSAASVIAQGNLDNILKRLLYTKHAGLSPHDTELRAVMGELPEPKLKLSGLVAKYEEKHEQDKLGKLSPNQYKKWRDGANRSVNEMVRVVGDPVLKYLTREEVLLYRSHLYERVKRGEITRDSANRAMTYIAGMYRTLSKVMGDFPRVWHDLRFTKNAYAKKKTFDLIFIQNVLLREGALDGLNEQARGIAYLCMDIGLRLSETLSLRREHIKLNADVPHIIIQDGLRAVKTVKSARVIPLAGLSLAVMRNFPDGFHRYEDRNGALSATLNKFFHENGFYYDNQTFKCFRDTFRDRLSLQNAEGDLCCYLMGHSRGGPNYGEGHHLHLSHSFIERISFTPPARL